MQEPHTPICPKCGYDQSGEIATWETCCPVDGVCSECGLDMHWANVMRPELGQVSWYVEHAQSFTVFVGRSIRTPWHLLIPHRFWKQLDPSKPVSITRLIVWAVLLILAVHTLVGVPNGYNAWIRSNWTGVDFPTYYQQHGNYAIAEMIFDGLCYPYFDALPRAYSHKWSLHIEQGWSGGWMEYLIAAIMTATGMLIAWVAIMLAIPKTRQLAKLRRVHVFRAIIISLVVITLSYEATHLIRVSYDLRWISRAIFPLMDGLPRLICWVWLLVFWGCAVHTGWRIRPSHLLIALGTVASILGGITLSVYVFLLSTS
jgi:hypothetical protein